MRFFKNVTQFRILITAALCAGATVLARAQDSSFLIENAPLPEARQMHSAAVVGDYLYILGGSNKALQPVASVLKAKIGPDGRLGEWAQTTSLPAPRLYASESTVTLSGVVYVIGGSAGILDSRNYNTAVYARQSRDGVLSQWQTSQPFPGTGVTAPTAVATPGYIHMLGGQSSDGPVPYVYSSPVLPTGHLGPWEEAPPMPGPLWYHHSAVSAGRVYAWAGLKGSANTDVSSDIFSAPIQSNGKIGQWRMETLVMPTPIYAGSTAVAGPYLMTFSPRLAGKVATNDAWYATANITGMSRWTQQSTNIPIKLYHASATDYQRGLIFLTGGRTDPNNPTGLLTNIYTFRLSKKARDAAYQQGQAIATASAGEDIGAGTLEGATSAEAAAAIGASVGVASFRTYEDAKRTGLPLAIYFHSEKAKLSVQQLEIAQDPEFKLLQGQVAVAIVDVLKNPQFAQQLGVWRVPTWIFFDRAGTETRRHTGVLTVKQISDVAPRR